MSARRQIGRAVVRVTATDRETDDRRWIYEVSISVGGKRLWSGIQFSQPGGTLRDGDLRRVALDSPEAFDAIARAAASINSVFLAEQPDPDEETASAIAEAIQEAQRPEDGVFEIRRIK